MNSEHLKKADNGNDSNSDPSKISMIWSFNQYENAFSLIFDTFDGMKKSLIINAENAYFSIVCKIEFGEISILVKFEQLSNAHDKIILIFDGMKIYSMSRRANKRLSKSSPFSFIFPNKYLPFINLNRLFNAEIIILDNLSTLQHHPSFNSLKLAGK